MAVNKVAEQLPSCATVFIKRLAKRIPMTEIHDTINTRHVLKPALNWYLVTGIGLGGIIGSGIFNLSGTAAAEYAGPSVIISFIASGIVAFLAALSFAELAAMMPLSGAAYTYTYASLGEYAAWFIGWNYALFYQLAACTVVVSWSKYVTHFIYVVSDYNSTNSLIQAPVAWSDDTQSFSVTGGAINLPAIFITIAITVLLISGIYATAIVNFVLVVIKIIILLIFLFATCKYVNVDNYKPFIPSNQGSFNQYGASGTAYACTYVFFAYVGFESIATVAEEAKERTKTLPYATIASMLISFLIYIGICTVMVGLVPYQSLNIDDPLSAALKATPYGVWLPALMDLGAIASLTTVALTVLLSQTRIFYAMAKDNLLPSFFAKTYFGTETPWVSTIISGIFCAVFSGICPVNIISEASSVSALFIYLFVHIEVLVMRCTYTHKGLQRPFQNIIDPNLIAVVGGILCILFLIPTKQVTWFQFLAWTAIGQVFYFCFGYWNSTRRQPQRLDSINSAVELVSTIESVSKNYPNSEFESDSNNNANSESESDSDNEATDVIIDNTIDDTVIMRF
ncbi:unnamed protein product [Adineta steineri]|uniref:Uncharacterized protein n=1 Tax=Adineta steineri TaxID=433720 RepID=A0A814RSG5_9BILA|nr:unnamed protein product [Adineta steineri]CAF1136819.1 unnamed protein product [Adineta steineri]